MDVSFNVNTSGLSAVFKRIMSAVDSPGPMRDGFTQASALYLGFIRRRFVQNSRGGGDWKPLAPSTIAGRRKGKGKGSVAILRDTSTLLNSLSTGAPGNIMEFLPDGVRVGTAIQYAKYHQDGGVHLPQRKIFVPPDPGTEKRIQQVLAQAMLKTIEQSK